MLNSFRNSSAIPDDDFELPLIPNPMKLKTGPRGILSSKVNDSGSHPSDALNVDQLKANIKNKKIRAYHYDISGHANQCLETYAELSGVPISSLRKVTTPCIEESQLPQADRETKGELNKVCARIVLQVLYLARMCRPDLYWAVNSQARMVTKWDVACDK